MKYPEVVKTLVLVNSQTAAPEVTAGIRNSMMLPCMEGDRLWRMRCEMEVLSYAPNIPSTWDEELFAAGVYMGGLPKAQEARRKMANGAGEPTRSEWNETIKQKSHDRLRAETILPLPVLLYWGYNDPQGTRQKAIGFFDILAAHHPLVRLQWVNRAGHFFFRGYPHEFNQGVIDFVDYWSREGAKAPAVSH